MGKVTFVVEYDDGKEPPVNGGTVILGGKLCAVSWNDFRDCLFSPEQRDIVIEGLNELTRDEVDADCHDEIIIKTQLLTL